MGREVYHSPNLKTNPLTTWEKNCIPFQGLKIQVWPGSFSLPTTVDGDNTSYHSLISKQSLICHQILSIFRLCGQLSTKLPCVPSHLPLSLATGHNSSHASISESPSFTKSLPLCFPRACDLYFHNRYHAGAEKQWYFFRK